MLQMKTKLVRRIAVPFFVSLILILELQPSLFSKNLEDSLHQSNQFWANDYFTEIITLVNSSYTQHLRLHKNGKFQLYRILLHSKRNWEESRYEGKWKQLSDDKIILRPNSCRVYTSRTLVDRRALTRAYDCDHIEMIFAKQINPIKTQAQLERFELRPDQYGSGHGESMNRFKNANNTQIAVVLSSNNDLIAWGIGLSFYKPGQRGRILSDVGIPLQEITIKEVIETSFRFTPSKSNSIKIGDIIQLPKR